MTDIDTQLDQNNREIENTYTNIIAEINGKSNDDDKFIHFKNEKEYIDNSIKELNDLIKSVDNKKRKKNCKLLQKYENELKILDQNIEKKQIIKIYSDEMRNLLSHLLSDYPYVKNYLNNLNDINNYITYINQRYYIFNNVVIERLEFNININYDLNHIIPIIYNKIYTNAEFNIMYDTTQKILTKYGYVNKIKNIKKFKKLIKKYSDNFKDPNLKRYNEILSVIKAIEKPNYLNKVSEFNQFFRRGAVTPPSSAPASPGGAVTPSGAATPSSGAATPSSGAATPTDAAATPSIESFKLNNYIEYLNHINAEIKSYLPTLGFNIDSDLKNYQLDLKNLNIILNNNIFLLEKVAYINEALFEIINYALNNDNTISSPLYLFPNVYDCINHCETIFTDINHHFEQYNFDHYKRNNRAFYNFLSYVKKLNMDLSLKFQYIRNVTSELEELVKQIYFFETNDITIGKYYIFAIKTELTNLYEELNINKIIQFYNDNIKDIVLKDKHLIIDKFSIIKYKFINNAIIEYMLRSIKDDKIIEKITLHKDYGNLTDFIHNLQNNIVDDKYINPKFSFIKNDYNIYDVYLEKKPYVSIVNNYFIKYIDDESIYSPDNIQKLNLFNKFLLEKDENIISKRIKCKYNNNTTFYVSPYFFDILNELNDSSFKDNFYNARTNNFIDSIIKYKTTVPDLSIDLTTQEEYKIKLFKHNIIKLLNLIDKYEKIKYILHVEIIYNYLSISKDFTKEIIYPLNPTDVLYNAQKLIEYLNISLEILEVSKIIKIVNIN